MKKNWFRRLLIRLRWTIRNLRRQERNSEKTTRKNSLKIILTKLLLRLAEIWHLIRLLISLIRRNPNDSGKS